MDAHRRFGFTNCCFVQVLFFCCFWFFWCGLDIFKKTLNCKSVWPNSKSWCRRNCCYKCTSVTKCFMQIKVLKFNCNMEIYSNSALGSRETLWHVITFYLHYLCILCFLGVVDGCITCTSHALLDYPLNNSL